MSGSEGIDYRIYLSDDGTATGDLVELECQGDTTINRGKTINTTKYKNCTHSRHSETGFQVTTSIGLERPMGAAQALLWAADEGKSSTYVVIKDKVAGGLQFAGMMKVAITEIGLPVDGDTTHSVTFGADGTIARTVVA